MSDLLRPGVGTWDTPCGDKTVTHVEVVAVAPPGGAVPDGQVHMAWVDQTNLPRNVVVSAWWRLDQQGLGPGVRFQIDIQARQERSMSFPQHHVSADLEVTGDPSDVAQVFIGNPDQVGSWVYGARFYGAVLLSTSMLVETGP